MNNSKMYRAKKVFLEWKGERPYTVELAEEYVRHLHDLPASLSTKLSRWHGCMSVFRQCSGMSEKEYHSEILWLSKKTKFSGYPPQTTRRLTESEYRIALEYTMSKSKRVALFMRAIREGDLKVTNMINLRPYPPYPSGLSDNLIFEIQKTFNSTKWLFETGGKKQHTRNYISQRIAKYTGDSIGWRASSEAIRPTGY